MLTVENLRKSYGPLEVLKGISFSIKKGSIYGFLGPNGAGKTTTMKILAGLLNFDGGTISLEGKNFLAYKNDILKRIGYLPQNPVFYNFMTGLEYLNFIGEICNMNEKYIKKRSIEVLEIVRLTNDAKRKIGSYSGGMKQRLGIAVSIFKNPDFLLLDEPTSSLDPEGRMEILEFIKSLKQYQKTVFFSTHILNDVERVCDEVSILNNGQIIISDTIDNLRNKYINPIFDVEYETISDNVLEKIRKIEYVSDVILDIKSKIISIFVKDINVAKNNLFKELSQLEIVILSYHMRKSSLEDIFIRLVKKDGNN